MAGEHIVDPIWLGDVDDPDRLGCYLDEHIEWLRTADEPELRTWARSVGSGARDSAAQQKSIETGTRGGRYYVSATGAKVYVKSNPGPIHLGHMQNQTFHQGLPMSVHLNEPRRK